MKHIRFKKSFWVLLSVVAIIVVGFVGIKTYLSYIHSNKYLLREKGYTEEQIEKIKDDEKLIKILLEREYNEDLLTITKEKYFLEKNLDKYLDYKKKNPKRSLTDVVAIVNVGADKDWYKDAKKTDTSKGILMLINKFNGLDEEFEVEELVDMSVMYAFNGKKIDKRVYDDFKSMANAAKGQGLKIVANSTYRSYNDQVKTYNSIKGSKGLEYADKVAARPGHSEHETGLAIDISTLKNEGDFEDTEEFKWLQEHAHEYGFILRYPKDKEYITGYAYESWHYRYVGIDVAVKIKKENITFDEYYAYYVEG